MIEMKNWGLLCCLCVGVLIAPLSVYGQSVVGNKKNQFIYIHSKRLNKKKFQDRFPNATVLTPADQLAAKRKHVLSLPRQKRFFLRSGLNRYVSNMDQFNKDLLVLSIRSLSVPKLSQRYKKIPKPVLSKAKRMLNSGKSS